MNIKEILKKILFLEQEVPYDFELSDSPVSDNSDLINNPSSISQKR